MSVSSFVAPITGSTYLALKSNFFPAAKDTITWSPKKTISNRSKIYCMKVNYFGSSTLVFTGSL